MHAVKFTATLLVVSFFALFLAHAGSLACFDDYHELALVQSVDREIGWEVEPFCCTGSGGTWQTVGVIGHDVFSVTSAVVFE